MKQESRDQNPYAQYFNKRKDLQADQFTTKFTDLAKNRSLQATSIAGSGQMAAGGRLTNNHSTLTTQTTSKKGIGQTA